MSAKRFLQDKQILSICNSEWIVRFEDGKEVDIVQLMEEYQTKMKIEADARLLNTVLDLLIECNNTESNEISGGVDIKINIPKRSRFQERMDEATKERELRQNKPKPPHDKIG